MSDPNKYTIGWISAIVLEYAAAQEFLDEKHDRPRLTSKNDENHYTLGRIDEHNVVMATLPKGENGIASAAIVARDLVRSFPHVRVCLMVGVGGGVPSARHDIRLGDVVISAPSFHGESGTFGGVVHYDYGKSVQERHFQSVRYLNRPPRALLTAVTGLETSYVLNGNDIDAAIKEIVQRRPRLRKTYSRPDTATDRLYSISMALVERPERSEDEDNPMVHYGLIASADSFMQNAEIRDLLAKELDVLCFEMEAAGLMNNLPCIVIRGICDYSDSSWSREWRGYAAMAAAACARDLVREVMPSQLDSERAISEVLDQISEDVKCIKATTASTTEQIRDLRAASLDADQKTVLDRLPVAAGASFESSAEEDNPTCLPNTRVQVLEQIGEWATSPHSKTIFWLNGMAGTGKSTLSRTVAEAFDKTGRLGASFFFQRGEGDRGKSLKFFTTMAVQLARRRPAMAPYIKRAIDANQGISDMRLATQFDKLIRDPLVAAPAGAKGAQPIVVVIDALDECECDQDGKLKPIIDLFLRDTSLGLRVFVTSRPDWQISRGFRTIGGQYQGIILHEIPRPAIEHDMSIFFNHKLAGIRTDHDELGLPADWPGPVISRRLVDMAVPLFIFAATICRFLGDPKWRSPDDRLHEVLDQRATGSQSRLDAMYLTVLNKLVEDLSEAHTKDALAQFRVVVGSIIVAASPISTAVLSRIMAVSLGTIRSQLSMLHSVLSIPRSDLSPVRLLHMSFHDFLLNPDKSRFWVDEKLAHRTMATGCLRVMTETLKKDICGLVGLGLRDSIMDKQKVDSIIPPELQYACLNWAFHLEGARDGIGHLCHDEVYGFLRRNFLQWVEAMSLMRRAPESVRIIKNLQALVQAGELGGFLEDALGILQSNSSIIASAPLQVYYSMLAFAPSRSVIRETFEHDLSEWTRRKPETGSNCMLRLEGHGSEAWLVAFSHDSSLVASAPACGKVRLWSTDTGECVQEFGASNAPVDLLAFSRHSQHVVTWSKDVVRLWSVDSGHCVDSTECRPDNSGITDAAFVLSQGSMVVAQTWSDSVAPTFSRIVTGVYADQRAGISTSSSGSSLTLSHDSALLAWASSRNGTVQLWRVDTSECLGELEVHRQPLHLVAFSHDSSLLVTLSRDSAVRLWCVDTGECVGEFETQKRAVLSMALSRDSSLVALSVCMDDAIQLWRLDTGERVQELRGHGGNIVSMAFSHDSSLIASASRDGTVRVWRVDPAMGVDEDQETVSPIVAMSHDSSLVASIADGRIVRLHRVDTGECVRKLMFDMEPMSVAFCHDSSLLALGLKDGSVQLWRTDTVVCTRKLHMSGPDVRRQHNLVFFSHDSTLVASRDMDDTIRIWRTDTGEFVQEIHAEVPEAREPANIPLHTASGSFTFVLPGNPLSSHDSDFGLSPNRDWITFNGQNFLWLPTEYRPWGAAIVASAIVLVSDTSKMLILLLSN